MLISKIIKGAMGMVRAANRPAHRPGRLISQAGWNRKPWNRKPCNLFFFFFLRQLYPRAGLPTRRGSLLGRHLFLSLLFPSCLPRSAPASVFKSALAASAQSSCVVTATALSAIPSQLVHSIDFLLLGGICLVWSHTFTIVNQQDMFAALYCMGEASRFYVSQHSTPPSLASTFSSWHGQM